MIIPDDDIGCGCSCHRMPGVMHCVPCCDAPPYDFRLPDDALDPGAAIAPIVREPDVALYAEHGQGD